MKKILSLFCLVTLFVVTACDNDNVPANGYFETTQDGAISEVLKGYISDAEGFTVCQPEGFDSPFYIQDKQFTGNAYAFAKANEDRLDAMTSAPVTGSWSSTVAIAENATYWGRYTGETFYHFFKVRVVSINQNNVTIEYVVTDTTAERPNENVNANKVGDTESVSLLEIPHLNGDYKYVDHYIEYDKRSIMNLAIEWVPSLNHSNWVAFSFDKTTCQDNVKRGKNWSVDPKLPEDMQVEESAHKSDGFDKGHLCASEDRVYSKEANDQTFFYSNISPQINDLNGGLWQKMEALVQNWGRSCSTDVFDAVYVTKGGTMNSLLINYDGEGKKGNDGILPVTDAEGKTIHGLACPKYYFMAVMTVKDGTYNTIGFLVEHKIGHPKNPTVEQMQGYVLSIDELEAKTGLDFFCNLKDNTENQVESKFDLNAWNWDWSYNN